MNRPTGMAVAIKTLRGEALSADPTLLDRFKQEIRLARKITHPNILRTHDLGETNGLRYLSMEFVKGITLKQMVEQYEEWRDLEPDNVDVLLKTGV